jgi:two-component system, OmpR family, response regulator PhoP
MEDIRMNVYIAESDDALRQKLMLGLTQAGFLVSGFADAPSFYEAFSASPCDMAVIGSVLGGQSSLSITSRLHDQPRTGIVALCDPDAAEMRVQCLECGADAYFVKPIDVREVAAQLRAIYRRLASVRNEQPEAQKSWELKESGWVLCDPVGHALHLTTAERAVLLCLLRMRGNPASRQELLLSLGGNPRYADPHRIDVLINRLRNKASSLNMTLPLHSVRSKGYMLIMEQITASYPEDHRTPAEGSLGPVGYRRPTGMGRSGISTQPEERT